MNGDVVSINGIPHEVEIQGRQGTYITVGKYAVNVAIGSEGFLRNLKTNESYRAKWSSLTVLQRAFPDMNPDKGDGKKKVFLKFVGVDSWSRPIFKDALRSEFYGSTDKLCGTPEEVSLVKVSDLLYFGNSFGCEPMGDQCSNKEEWIIL
jgi:hypothetical protein